MSLWNWITTGGKTVDKLTDAVINSGDAIFYTDEEKAEDAAKRRDMWFKFMELSRSESSIRSVTRRIIALAVLCHWLLFLDVALVLYLSGREEMAKAVFAMASGDMALIVGGIAAFYFGAHLMRAKQ